MFQTIKKVLKNMFKRRQLRYEDNLEFREFLNKLKNKLLERIEKER